MVMKKNPLRKRYLRDLRGDIGKYLVIFVLLVLTISEVSGFLVAENSMISAYNESFTKYNTEHGNFTTQKKMNAAQKKRVEVLHVTLYDLFYSEMETDNGSTLRVFADRKEVNIPCVMEGTLPEQKDEIAIDRMYAQNNGIAVGDTLHVGDNAFTVSGLVALPDYSALFSDNNDSMFDALRFGVGVVTQEAFDAFGNEQKVWRYAWKYETEPSGEEEEKEMADDFLAALAKEVSLGGYIPRYLNQAIQYAGSDLGSDRATIQMFFYIVVVIITFVFAITTSNTIAKESTVIGTLRASGFTKGELVRHYLFLPLAVTLVAALIGNILGYTVLKEWNASLYYNSYSLPTYETRWNAQAFVQTTVLPVIIMILVNTGILTRRLSLSPLQFLRRELKKKSGRGAMPLSKRIPFFTRFRTRVILQNRSNYLLLGIGIFFANVLLMFGLMMPSMLDRYESRLPETMLSNYQYILQLPAGAIDEEEKLAAVLKMMRFSKAMETDNPDAEKFSAQVLRTYPDGDYKGEDILLYGIGEDSRYVSLELQPGDVYISSTYAEKMYLNIGDTVTLKEPYGDAPYDFTITGISDYEGSLSLFLPQADLNERFDLGRNTFTGYFSDTEITDIDQAYIGQVIDEEALTKVSRQLTHSIGDALVVINAFSVAIFITLVFLLSKIIIEKNAQSISMTKILGYTGREISALYIVSTTIMVLLFILISLPLCYRAMEWLFRVLFLSKMNGWIPYYIGREVYLKMIAMGILTYAIVAVAEYHKIRKIPMEEALKNVE